MIYQRFYPVKVLLDPIQDLCCPAEDEYFSEQYSLDSAVVSKKILASEKILLDTLERLSKLKEEKDVLQQVQSLNPECRFLLHTAIRISFLYFHADTELFPVLTPDKTYYYLFAYIQEGFLSFKKYCQQQNLDLWDQIFSYECDRLEDL